MVSLMVAGLNFSEQMGDTRCGYVILKSGHHPRQFDGVDSYLHQQVMEDKQRSSTYLTDS